MYPDVYKRQIYELPDVSLYYYRFAVKNICAVNSAARFASMKTAAAFEKRDRPVSYTHLDVYKRQALSWA